MRDCIFHNKTVAVFALFLVVSAPVFADDDANASSAASIELVADNSNPWALPDEARSEPEVPVYKQQFEQELSLIHI